jgi:sugar-specific transcriptional regulator TrmB
MSSEGVYIKTCCPVVEDTPLLKFLCVNIPVEREKVSQSLGSLGLSKMEAEVYLYVSANPETTAGEVTKQLKIARSKTYEALDKLSSMGLISRISQKEVNRFHSSGSSVISALYKKKMREAEEAVEYIRKMDAFGPSETRINMLDGIDGYKTAKESFLARLNPGEEMLVIGSPGDLGHEVSEYLKRFHAKRIAMGVKLRIIYNADVAVERIRETSKWENTLVRCLPKNNSPAWIEVYNDSVLIPLFSERVTIIAITDKSISTSFKNYFEILWKGTKKLAKATRKRGR